VLVEGDEALSISTAIRVSPEHCPNVRTEPAQRFVDWITGPEGSAIAGFHRRSAAVLPQRRGQS
jgi:ABC-type tungstate transport system permease subunit